MTAQLSPQPVFRAFDNSGAPLAFGKLFTYAAGTSTPQATYVDSSQTTPNTNPIILNARGEANVWLDPTLTYKFVLAYSTDSNPPTNPIWTVNNITTTGGIVLTMAMIGAVLWPQSQAEKDAGVTPLNYGYPWLNPYRYGADGGGGVLDQTALTSIQTILPFISGIDAWQNGLAVAGFEQTPAEVTAITADPTIEILNYGESPGNALRTYSGSGDITKAVMDALACNSTAYIDYPGIYRLDDTVTIGSPTQTVPQELRLGKGVILQRQALNSASTGPLIHLKGLYARMNGGSVVTQNDAPGGIICCGHLDTSTSTWNSFWWRLEDTDITGKDYLGTQTALAITAITKANPGVVTVTGSAPANGTMFTIRSAAGMTEVNFNTYLVAGSSGSTFNLTGNGITSSGNIDTSGYGSYTSGGQLFVYPVEGQSIGVYVPSSQPVKGNTVANYYGKITNVHVQTSTTPFWLTDISNAHQLTNISFNGIYWNGLVLQGSYGNHVTMGFGDSGYQNGCFPIYLRVQGNPGAPHASSIGTSRNVIDASNFELGTLNNTGVFVSQSDGKQTNNWVRFRWNTNGAAISDAAAANDIFVDTVPAVFQYAVAINGAVPTSGTTIGTLYLGNGTSASATSGSSGALPGTPAGYWTIAFGSSRFKLAYYLP